jgi:hypothetical protein
METVSDKHSDRLEITSHLPSGRIEAFVYRKDCTVGASEWKAIDI